MFEFIRKIFKMAKTDKKDKDVQQPQSAAQNAAQSTKKTQTSTQHANKPITRKFEIQVFDVEEVIDENTGVVVSKKLKPAPVDPLHPITTIEASTKEELDQIAQTFAMCGQQMKIVREVTQSNSSMQLNAQKPPASNQSSMVQRQNANQQSEPQYQQQQTYTKPKMFSSGGIDFKFDGQKMYQKQWIKLSPAEAASIRVISDATNKIVCMKGKHFEAQKWIAIEETDDDICKD